MNVKFPFCNVDRKIEFWVNGYRISNYREILKLSKWKERIATFPLSNTVEEHVFGLRNLPHIVKNPICLGETAFAFSMPIPKRIVDCHFSIQSRRNIHTLTFWMAEIYTDLHGPFWLRKSVKSAVAEEQSVEVWPMYIARRYSEYKVHTCVMIAWVWPDHCKDGWSGNVGIPNFFYWNAIKYELFMWHHNITPPPSIMADGIWYVPVILDGSCRIHFWTVHKYLYGASEIVSCNLRLKLPACTILCDNYIHSYWSYSSSRYPGPSVLAMVWPRPD